MAREEGGRVGRWDSEQRDTTLRPGQNSTGHMNTLLTPLQTTRHAAGDKTRLGSTHLPLLIRPWHPVLLGKAGAQCYHCSGLSVDPSSIKSALHYTRSRKPAEWETNYQSGCATNQGPGCGDGTINLSNQRQAQLLQLQTKGGILFGSLTHSVQREGRAQYYTTVLVYKVA